MDDAALTSVEADQPPVENLAFQSNHVGDCGRPQAVLALLRRPCAPL